MQKENALREKYNLLNLEEKDKANIKNYEKLSKLVKLYHLLHSFNFDFNKCCLQIS